MAPSTTIKKSYQSYKTAGLKLETQLEQLRRKREEIESRTFVVLEESDDTAASNGKRLVEEQEVYRSEVNSLVSTATDILLEILELKLSFVQEALHKLSTLMKDSPRGVAPPELGFSRYEEWLETNQRLFELNSQLYDLEKLKFEIRHKKKQARRSIAGGGAREGEGLEGSLFVQSSIQRIQGFLTKFQFPSDATSTSQTYIQDLLSPRGDRTTLEAQKVQEYVTECMQHPLTVDSSGNPRGAHQQRYQEFMGVLCGYIVEKQREWQGEELPYDLVYNTVERHLMPKVKSAVLRHVAQADRDEVISRQCQTFSNVTLEQLRVKPELRSPELVPFIDSISSLRASYFSPNPTDKMYTIVAAAKALYDQLGVMGEMSIDGDSFLDLWIYVILKANVRDLATNLCFMVEYGNPQLANDEAGYYLTTLEAAVSFIEKLVPEQLNLPRIQEDFVVCERGHFSQLARLPGSCFQVVKEGVELQGYQVAIIQEWALNRARLFKSVLVPTGERQDTAVVDIVRLSTDSSSAAHLQHFSQALLNPKRDMECLQSQSTPFGVAVVVDITACDPLTLIILPSGDFDKHSRQVERILQLTRLGSQGRGESCDVCIIPSTPSEEMSFLTAPEMRSGFSDGPGMAIPLRSTLTSDDRSLKSSSVSENDPYLLHSHLRQSYTESIASGRSWQQSNASFANGIGKGGSQHQALGSPSSTAGGSKPATSKTVTLQAEVYDPTLSGVSSYFSSSELRTDFPAALPTAVPDVTASLKPPVQDKPDLSSQSSLPPSFAPVSPPSRLLDILRPKKSAGQEEKEFRLSQMYYFDDSCPINVELVNPLNILSPQYGKELEGNFVENHLFGDLSQPLDKAMSEIITQGQLYLQRLNYLSITQTLDGMYDDATLFAVERFQIAHNSHESMYSTVLPENGHLTVPTFQYLRQSFLTIFASLLRLGLDRNLGKSFNPMSTASDDILKFRESIDQFQREQNMAMCQKGTLCANTIEKIRYLLRTRRHTIS